MNTAFIGGGNMATALISGLNRLPATGGSIRVSDPSTEVSDRLHRDFGLRCSASLAEAIDDAQVILLAVKPQVVPLVLRDLSAVIAAGQLVISVAAGIKVQTLLDALGASTPVIRSMPNTPALLQKGVTGLYAGPGCEQAHQEMAEQIMGAVGATVWVEDEALIDVVTAVSGSGPAYFYLLAEAMRAAGTSLGLPPEVAASLVMHTANGAGAMAAESGVDIAELRRQVTSPGGTTQAALETLQGGGFEDLVFAAVEAAVCRGRELAGTEASK